MKKAFGKFIGLSVFVISALFISCQSTKNAENKTARKNLEKVFVTNTKTINILPPDCLEKDIDCVYMFSAAFEKNEFSVLSYIQADDSGFFIDLLNGFGTSMGSILYEENNVEVDSSIIPEKLKGEYIINDLQLVFYKADSLKKNYKKSKLNFEEKISDETNVRSVKSGKKLIEQAEITENKIKIVNYLRKYQYELTFSGL